MTEKQLIAAAKRYKIKQASEFRAYAKRDAKDKDAASAQYWNTRAETWDARDPLQSLALPYQIRNKIFKGCNGKLTFDPATGLALSYFNGYQIAKRINGRMVLNSYRYSVTTQGHVETLRNLFGQLGISYREIEAPKGLQDLQRALEHHTFRLAEWELKDKHSPLSYEEPITRHRRAIAWLRKHTLASTFNGLMKLARQCAEDNRAQKLKEEAKARFYKNIKFINIYDDTPEQATDAIGVHAYCGDIPGAYEQDNLRREAANATLKNVYLHIQGYRSVMQQLNGHEAMEVKIIKPEASNV